MLKSSVFQDFQYTKLDQDLRVKIITFVYMVQGGSPKHKKRFQNLHFQI